MQFQNQTVIELKRGDASILVAPQYGGRLLRWCIGEHEVIRWPADADWRNPAKIRGGNPLLFPFLGRHRVDGELGKWRDASGHVYALPVHGFARDMAFAQALSADGYGVRVTLTDDPVTRAGYPFAFRFEASYRLLDHALEVELTTHNIGDAALPYYAGDHFYFNLPHALRGETTLELPPNRQRHQEANGDLSPAVPGSRRYTLDDPAIIDRFHVLDAPGPARLVTPTLGRTVTFDLERPDAVPWYAVTTWTEQADADFYCVEPWLGLPDAIHNQQGLRWLAPGRHETASVRLTVDFTS